MYSIPQNRTLHEILEDEILMIENGGEIPEVTYHGSLYFLERDPDGPQITVLAEDHRRLKLAVIEGYRRIIIRDLKPENREKRLYRGLERCAANWHRLRVFCQREQLDYRMVADEVCEWVKRFFITEINDVISLGKSTCVNCTVDTLSEFFNTVGFSTTDLPEEWKLLGCRNQENFFQLLSRRHNRQNPPGTVPDDQ